MLTWKEACAKVGYDPKESCPITRVKVYWAYRKGETKECASKEEASQFSENYESGYTPESTVAWDAYWDARRKKEGEALNLWYRELRAYYDMFTDAQFSVCYGRAYSEGHSAGYDEVASELADLADFIQQFQKAT